MLAEEAIEEAVHVRVQLEPPAMHQRLVRVIRHHIARSARCAREQVNEADRLREIHVSVVVALPHEHRRLPPSIAEIDDDLYDTSAVSSELPQRCTPAMSTPAANMSELRASACAVSTPP